MRRMTARRAERLERLGGEVDLLVLGGGATGLGIAVDATTRGYRTVLVEGGDFAQATSSRATKLVHGGVRYLASGQIHLVREALHERRVMLRNAPHLVASLGFVTPAYGWWDLPFYGAGLRLYDLLSGKASMGRTRVLGSGGTRSAVPGIAARGLKGSVLYFDGQFDDARFALALARTAEDHGATVLNYVRCVALRRREGRVCGARVRDEETGAEVEVGARAVVNATGIFADEVRRMDDPMAKPLLSVSRGTHVVVGAEVLGGETAIMVPKTPDGRVIFAIPWLGKVVIGTTDLPAVEVAMEPGHEESEIEFLLETINPYLARRIGRGDVLSVFSGLRPLITGAAATTAKLSREHHIEASASGLVTVAGGKWTTYRRMAEDTVDLAIGRGLLEARGRCVTAELPLRGAGKMGEGSALSRYGSDAVSVEALQAEGEAMRRRLDAALPFSAAEVVYAVREEMARTVEDVLSRRTRALLLDARAAERAAGLVAEVMAGEMGYDAGWAERQVREFCEVAQRFYQVGDGGGVG